MPLRRFKTESTRVFAELKNFFAITVKTSTHDKNNEGKIQTSAFHLVHELTNVRVHQTLNLR